MYRTRLIRPLDCIFVVLHYSSNWLEHRGHSKLNSPLISTWAGSDIQSSPSEMILRSTFLQLLRELRNSRHASIIGCSESGVIRIYYGPWPVRKHVGCSRMVSNSPRYKIFTRYSETDSKRSTHIICATIYIVDQRNDIICMQEYQENVLPFGSDRWSRACQTSDPSDWNNKMYDTMT